MARLFGNTGATPASPGYYEETNGTAGYQVGEDYLVNDAGNRLSLTDGTTNLYVKATGTIKAQNTNPVDWSAPYNYGDEATFKKSVDLSVAGLMRDCAECHVGGGALEYLPKPGSTDLSTGTCETKSVVYGGVTYTSNGGDPCSAATGAFTEAEQYDPAFSQCGTYQSAYGLRNFECIPTNAKTELRSATLTGYNAWNAFIDQYDEDDDGITGEVLTQDYSQTGVIEMDCLMCHMEGYSWDARTESLRKGKFDASRVTGAGLGTAVSGTTVAYDSTVVGVSASASSLNALTLGAAGLNVHPSVSENCASCHMDMHQVDWKKRGDFWGVPYEADVHGSLGCMGCHDRKDETYYTGAWRTYNDLTKLTGIGSSNLLGHDPAKGLAPYSSLWNNTDNTMKNCQDCHTAAPTVENFGAADPSSKHASLGLTATLLQTGVDGVANASHIDILECSTCHVRKLGHGPTAADGGETHGSLYEWGTGGAMVDGTGADEAGRLTDHENLYVERTMEDNLALAWQGGKLIKANALTTMFWRDKNDTTLDINADGQIGQMDAVNPSHIRDANKAAELHALTADGVVDATEIAAQRAAILNYLPNVGITPTGANLKLNFMGVMFKVNHNVNPARYAWGAGGCTDCHGANKGFYNGTYAIKPRDLTFSYRADDPATSPANESDVVPLTLVNGTQPSDFHPTLYAKPSQGDNRSIALVVRGATALRDIDRSEALWETTLRKPITPTLGGAAIGTRAAWVSYLDGMLGLYNPGMHTTHALIKNSNGSNVFSCTTCHTEVGVSPDVLPAITTNWDSGPAGYTAGETINPQPVMGADTCKEWGIDNADGITGTEDDYVCVDLVPGVPTGRYTCATACHPSTVGSAPEPTMVNAHLSARPSLDTDRVIYLEAGYSYCDSTCSYSFDDADCSGVQGVDQAGNPVPGQWVVTCPDATSARNFSVTVTDADSGETATDAVTATPQIVEPEVLDAGFTSAVAGKTVTLTGAGLDANIVRAYIYWGDRKSNSVTPAQLAAGVAHTYTTSVDKTYDISVKVLAADYSQTTYTVADDGDLQVSIDLP